MQSHSVTGWLQQLRDGDESAAEAIWKRFYQRLVTVAARRLGSGRTRVADGEDVALDALDSFCRRVEAGAYPNLNDRDELWRLLLTITENKAFNQIRKEGAEKRGGGNVRGDSVFFCDNESAAGGFDRFDGLDPTPEDAAIMEETLGELLAQLTDGQRQIAVKKLEGYTNREISDDLNLSVATVERRLRQTRLRWSDALPMA